MRAGVREIGIGVKLLAAFLVVVSLTALVGLIGARSARALHAHTAELAESDVGNLLAIGTLNRQVTEIQADVMHTLAIDRNSDAFKVQVDQFAAFDATVNQALEQVASSEDGEKLGPAVAAVRSSLTAYNAIRDDEVVARMRRGDVAGAEFVVRTKLYAATEAVIQAQEQLAEAQGEVTDDVKLAADTSYASTRRLIVAMTLAALLLSILIAVAFSRRLSLRLRRLTDGTRIVGDGDLAHRVDVAGNDELGQMADAFNDLVDRLQEAKAAEVAARAEGQRSMAQRFEAFAQRVAGGDLTAQLPDDTTELGPLAANMNRMVRGLGGMSGEVRAAAEEMAGATAQILSVVSQHTDASSLQAASIAQTSVTVDEIRATSQQAATRAQALTEQARTATVASETGQEAVARIMDGMASIRAKVEEIAGDIAALSARTRAIEDITATVNDLADQSNMLALNATIEAARAGEHGRGFAVVADQVRSLAEQSKAATGQVREILSEIQRAADKAVSAADEGTRVVEVGVAGASQAGEAIRRIDETVRETAQVAAQIAASAKEQSFGMEQIGRAITDVAASTTSIADGATQTHAAARSLAELAARLDHLTSRYVLHAGATTASDGRAPATT